MSWSINGSGHFYGETDNAKAKEAKLIQDLMNVFAEVDVEDRGSVSFSGQFHGVVSLTSPSED